VQIGAGAHGSGHGLLLIHWVYPTLSVHGTVSTIFPKIAKTGLQKDSYFP
jgi:hypothetical protein